MLNGWFTIVAQAINFLILVWLLKRFLYKPIVQGIDAREQGIAAQLAAAVAKEANAQEKSDEFQRKNDDFDKQRASLLTKATDDAKAERDRLIDNARKDSDALRASRQAALQAEQQHLNHEIRLWTQNQVFAIARKTLADLASPSLEARMTQVFITRLRGLAGSAKDQMVTALKTSPATAMIRSAVDLPTAQQNEIETAVKESFDSKLPIQFQFRTSPELISGIELSANGQKVAWSINEYLTNLETSAGALLRADDKTELKPKSGPQPASRSSANGNADARPGPQPVVSAPKGAA